MQQVFGVMNKLLQVEPRTKLRRLQVRTYKVVPLSQRSGVIEWCENTQTFGEYLIGQSKDAGAHALYRPEDIKPSGCRKKLNVISRFFINCIDTYANTKEIVYVNMYC